MEGLVYQVQRFCKRNAATILTCAGGVGVVLTSITVAKATPKATQLLEQAKEEKGEELTKLEKVKVAGPVYIPSILMGAGTIGCIFGANILNKRHQAALVSAYTLVDSSYKDYKRKLKEIYGEEAHNEIIDALAVEKAEQVGVRAPGIASDNTLFVDEKCGETRLFYDEHSGRFFETTLEQVISAEYHLNRNYTLRGYVWLNEFYMFLGIEQTDYGSVIGWSTESGFEWIDFDHRKTEINGIECYIIYSPLPPEYDFTEDY